MFIIPLVVPTYSTTDVAFAEANLIAYLIFSSSQYPFLQSSFLFINPRINPEPKASPAPVLSLTSFSLNVPDLYIFTPSET